MARKKNTNNIKQIDDSDLSNIIFGRGRHIYAFTTETIPNYLKVGDTYRPVDRRLNEWRRYYPNLEKRFNQPAKVDGEDKYFRDLAVHEFLVNNGKLRIRRTDIDEKDYHSQEFFKDATVDDVKNAIDDIIGYYKNVVKTGKGYGKYIYYNREFAVERPIIHATEECTPRDNQKTVIDKFDRVVKAGRKNLLMCAVMRFGKTFTSMKCAQRMKAKVVVIVSAKADVENEWENTILSDKNLSYETNKKSGYIFKTRDDLEDDFSIKECLKSDSNARVAIFLTLQHLNNLRKKEGFDGARQIFDEEIKIDLLIVDETHFGARGDELGTVLYGSPVDDMTSTDNGNLHADEDDDKDDDDMDLETANAIIYDSKLKRDVTLHLSGTPYRILLNYNEFETEDIIAFIQYSDILKERDCWDDKNVDIKGPGRKDEWENPYFGFPEMVRFAFNLNTSSYEKLNRLKNRNSSYDLEELFYPKSMSKVKNGAQTDDYREFVHKSAVLDFLKVIDGKKSDDKLMSFLDYDGLKRGEMCRHIVMVLPHRASCDAMAKLLHDKKDAFKNLNEYIVLNIAGFDCDPRYRGPDGVDKIKSAIKNYEDNGKKTITLTVKRMLTGCTVPQWDTMLFLRETHSPQEYDQAIFRLQNTYVKKIVGSDIDDDDDDLGKESKRDKKADYRMMNMKPQTLLVDFDPMRMFKMQENRARIFNLVNGEAGNNNLEKTITDELKFSPIITNNAGKLQAIDATNIMEEVIRYNNNRGIKDEALDVPVDLNLLKNPIIFNVINNEGEIGKKGSFSVNLVCKQANDSGGDIDIEDVPDDGTNKPNGRNTDDDGEAAIVEDEQSHLVKKIQNYHARILLFAFVTDNRISSLKGIIDSFTDSDANVRDSTKRIVKNLGLDEDIISLIYDYYNKSNKTILDELDKKILSLNELANSDMSVEAKINTALKKFGKLDDAIVVTPSNICRDMLKLITDDEIVKIISSGGKILDPVSTAGEFAVAFYNRILKLSKDDRYDISTNDIKDYFYSTPKSSVCYELTRKTYNMLGLNIENISAEFTSYDLIDLYKLGAGREGENIAGKGAKERNGQEFSKTLENPLTQGKKFSEINLDDLKNNRCKKVNFDLVVGNPPYQIRDGGAQSSAAPVYPYFVNMAKRIATKYVAMIIQSRWMTSGKGLGDFRKEMLHDKHIIKLYDYEDFEDCFTGVDIKGGVCYFLWNREKEDKCEIHRFKNGKASKSVRYLYNEGYDVFIRYPQYLSIHRKVVKKKMKSFKSIVSARKPYGLPSNFFDNPEKYGMSISNNQIDNGYKILGLIRVDGKKKKRRIYMYVDANTSLSNKPGLNKFKIFVPNSYGQGNIGEFPPSPVLAGPKVLCTETFLEIGPWDTEIEAINASQYMKTKFFRCLVSIRKQTQHATKSVYSYVPLPDFKTNTPINWSKTISEIDLQLYTFFGFSDRDIKFIESNIK